MSGVSREPGRKSKGFAVKIVITVWKAHRFKDAVIINDSWRFHLSDMCSVEPVAKYEILA